MLWISCIVCLEVLKMSFSSTSVQESGGRGVSRYVILDLLLDLRLWLTGPPMHDYWSRDFFLLPFLRCDVVVFGCVVLIFCWIEFYFCNIHSLIKVIGLCCFLGVLGSILWQRDRSAHFLVASAAYAYSGANLLHIYASRFLPPSCGKNSQKCLLFWHRLNMICR